MEQKKSENNNSVFLIHRVQGERDMWDDLMPRCFITGEFCPHRKKIIQRKIKHHAQNEVTIFMVMDYSDISDAIYEWLMEDLLKNDDIRFKFDSPVNGAESRSEEGTNPETFFKNEPLEEDDPHLYSENGRRRKIFKKYGVYIELLRADDYSSSSHVICESVCAKIQESDLVIVDVSRTNPNVFYELGLAVALNKQILPICYQDSYYSLREKKPDENDSNDDKDIYEFPWKEKLYKSFSINSFEDDGRYKEYRDDDRIYGHGHYKRTPKGDITMGKHVINLLNDAVKNWRSDNRRRNDVDGEKFLDDLMLYTLNGFNQTNTNKYIQAYREVVVNKVWKAMRSSGDRICLFYSDKKIEEPEKSSDEKGLKYSFGDICGLAINQVTYELDSGKKATNSRTSADRFMMNYLYNRAIKCNIEYPINMDFVNHKYFKTLGILTEDGNAFHEQKNEMLFFSHLDVFLAYISSCNTAFLDLRSNSLEAFFWLGVLHGSGRLAVPLRYTTNLTVPGNPKRDVIDIAGLWNAYFVDSNPNTFKKGIRSVMHSIYDKRGHLRYYEKMQLLTWISQGAQEDTIPKQKYESFFQHKFWSELMAHGNVDLCPTPVERDSQNCISNWEYGAFKSIVSYVNSFNHVNDLEFTDILELYKEWEKNTETNARTYLQNNPKSRIVLGDRYVNKFSKAIIADYEDKLYRMRRCDQCSQKAADTVSCKNEQLPDGEPGTLQSYIRGFYLPTGTEGQASVLSKTCDYYTKESLKEGYKANELKYEVLGHLMIYRNCAAKAEGDNAKISHKTDTSLISVVLEGSSGPGTWGIAEMLTREAPANGQNTDYLFLSIQTALLRKYQKLLTAYISGDMPEDSKEKIREKMKNDQPNNDWLDAENKEAIIKYLISNLCNCFLPVVTDEFLDAFKLRAWCFLHAIRGKDSTFTAEPLVQEYLYYIIEEWIMKIQSLRCTEAIIDIHVTSSYGIENNKIKDNRKVEKLCIDPATIQFLNKKGDDPEPKPEHGWEICPFYSADPSGAPVQTQ